MSKEVNKSEESRKVNENNNESKRSMNGVDQGGQETKTSRATRMFSWRWARMASGPQETSEATKRPSSATGRDRGLAQVLSLQGW